MRIELALFGQTYAFVTGGVGLEVGIGIGFRNGLRVGLGDGLVVRRRVGLRVGRLGRATQKDKVAR
jgi:hypothetical protein